MARDEAAEEDDARTRLLDPVDRISEILFGLIMAVTIVGSVSIASAGKVEVRTALIGALGCNLAWGLVDAVMYLVRTLTERTRARTLARRIASDPPEAGRLRLARALPDQLAAILGDHELEAMRHRIASQPLPAKRALGRDDWLAALAVFGFVVVATFPVVLPFLLFEDIARAMAASRWVTLASLFAAGFALARYAGYARPWITGLAMALFGALLIVTVMALGG